MSVLWTHCPFFILNVSVLYHRTFPNADPSTWSFYFPLPCYSSLSYQLRKDFTKLIGPDHPLQLNILTSYYHPKFPFIFIWFCDWYLLSPSWWELQWLCLLFFHCFCFQCLAHNLLWMNKWVSRWNNMTQKWLVVHLRACLVPAGKHSCRWTSAKEWPLSTWEGHLPFGLSLRSAVCGAVREEEVACLGIQMSVTCPFNQECNFWSSELLEAKQSVVDRLRIILL